MWDQRNFLYYVLFGEKNMIVVHNNVLAQQSNHCSDAFVKLVEFLSGGRINSASS